MIKLLLRVILFAITEMAQNFPTSMDFVQKSFLATCVNRRTIPLEEAMEILAEMCRKAHTIGPSNREELLEFIEITSKTIAKSCQKLELFKHPVLKKEFVLWTPTNDQKVAQDQRLVVKAEIHLFHTLLRELLREKEFCASVVEHLEFRFIMNEAALQMNMEHAAALMGPQFRNGELIKRRLYELREIGYLIEDDGEIYVEPRSLAELKNYMHVRYPDAIKKCILCEEPLFWIIKCQYCAMGFHRDCVRIDEATDAANCPSCKKPWNTAAWV